MLSINAIKMAVIFSDPGFNLAAEKCMLTVQLMRITKRSTFTKFKNII